jgi:hypothetical protein
MTCDLFLVPILKILRYLKNFIVTISNHIFITNGIGKNNKFSSWLT